MALRLATRRLHASVRFMTTVGVGDAPVVKVPFCCQKGPYEVTVEKNKKYFWCACGLSKKQPWCDGSHKGTGMKSIPFVAEDDKLWMCGCKQTKTPPFCDGTHEAV